MDINDKERKEILSLIKSGVSTELTAAAENKEAQVKEQKLRKYEDMIRHLQGFQDRLRDFKESGKEIIKLIDKKALL
ncbi:unnamed protein product [Arctia plantaginis]|uniref:Uncharacterized protein n=1 Tax=Arctia plantaginis TaxID=874455 RepID=A0A8S0YW13_ARCPL|nr:unnamed protein product [Arctia plantaginis]CAB3232244.1 unnamed protein product [Arctia plantaginis]